MLTLLTIGGGVALLLFSVRFLRKGLDRLFGNRLGLWIQQVGSRRGWAFLTGFGIAIAAPSSTTLSLLAVQTVQAGQMSASQMLAVMLGANIGLTILVQLTAVELEHFAPIGILFGVLLFQVARSSRYRGIGQVLLSLALLFMAMGIIKTAVVDSQLVANPDFQEFVSLADKYPLILAGVAAVLTLVLQSSTATLGLMIGLAATGAASFRTAVPVIIGANVGQALTTLIIGFRHVDSRRLAVGNLLLKLVVGSGIMVALHFLGHRLPAPSAAALPFWIAGGHTLFNGLVALVGLPTINLGSSVLQWIVPASAAPDDPDAPRYIRSAPTDSVALAMGQSRREIVHMSEIVRDMYQDVWRAMLTDDETLARKVSLRDDKVDFLDTQIKRYLTSVIKDGADPHDMDEQMRQLRYATELERIGDVIDKNLSELVIKKIRLNAGFTEQGQGELQRLYEMVNDNLLIAETAFTTRDPALARQLLRHKEHIDSLEHELRDRHFARLNAGLRQAHETSAIHLDILSQLKRINSCLTYVAHAILHQQVPNGNGNGPAPTATAE